MRRISLQELAKELNVDESAVYKEIEEVITQVQKTSERAIYDKKTARIFILTNADINCIVDGKDKAHFMDLAASFNIPAEDLNWLLTELADRKIITEEVKGYYLQVKEKPSVKAWFEPETISVGEKATLNIEINTLSEIQYPSIDLKPPSGLELEEQPKLPSKMFKGKFIEKYQFEPNTFGDMNVEITLGGTIEGAPLAEENVEAALKVLPLPPELIISQDQKNYDQVYLNPFMLMLEVTNNGSGAAQNVELKGLENYPEFEVLEPTKIGNVAAHGSVARSKISLKPKKSGVFRFEKLTVAYEDLAGKAFSSVVPTFEVNVVTPQPKVKIEFLYPEIIEAKHTFLLDVKMSNVGEGDAKNISFTLPLDQKYVQQGGLDCNIPRLKSNSTEHLTFRLQAPEEGKIEIPDFNVETHDNEEKDITEKVIGATIQVGAVETDTSRSEEEPQAPELIEKIQTQEETQAPTAPASLPSAPPASLPSAPVANEIDLDMVKTGTAKDWLKQMDEAIRNNAKIKLPVGSHSEKQGYRNLLIALYSAKQKSNNIVSILADKSLIKIAGYLRKLKDGDEIIVSPSDSTLADLDETISIMCGRMLPEKVRDGNVVTSIFKFVDAYKKEVAIEKKITLNPVTKRANRISFIRK